MAAQSEAHKHVPRLAQRRLHAYPEGAWALNCRAALLFADISGFTRLSTRLSPERLKGVINAFFTRMLGVVEDAGGDVLKFAGDAVMILWPVLEGEGECRDELQAAASAATAAADLQRACGDYVVPMDDGGDDVTLRLHSGIGLGDVRAFVVESLGRREFLIAGAPLRQIAATEAEAQPGEQVASREAWAVLSAHCGGAPTAQGNARLVDVEPLRALALGARAAPVAPPPPVAALEAFVHEAALPALRQGLLQLKAELREVAVLFVNVSRPAADPQLADMQRLMAGVNEELRAAGGLLRQFIVDDKGTVLIGSFGLVKGEHDCERALLAAQRIAEAAGATVGVTFGPAFCGLIGSDRRCEYSIMGASVNLAARLMASPQNPGVMCDERIRASCDAQWTFRPLGSIAAKGYAEPVAVFAPLEAISAEQRLLQQAAGADADEVSGRDAELRRLACALCTFRPRVVVVRGRAGMGKSTLLRRTLAMASERDYLVLIGASSSLDSATVGAAWRNVVLGAVEASVAEDDNAAAMAVRYLCDVLGDGDDARLPLLAELLPPGLVSPGFQQELAVSADERALLRNALLLDVVRHAAAARRTVLVLEDAHWLDPLSWSLLDQVLSLPGLEGQLLVVMSTRPMEEYHPDGLPAVYSALLPEARVVDVDRLSAAASARLAADAIGARELPAAVAAPLVERAEGNPLFLRTLALGLVEQGVLRVDLASGECVVLAADFAAVRLPSSVQDAIIARVDRLPVHAQAVLRAGSVIGREFDADVLALLRPCEAPDIVRALDECVGNDLLQEGPGDHGPSASTSGRDSPVGGRRSRSWSLSGGGNRPRALSRGAFSQRYSFTHVLVPEAAYTLMLEQERRAHHAVLAQHFAATQQAPLVAHHWAKAGEPLRAARALLEVITELARESCNALVISKADELCALLDGDDSPEALRLRTIARVKRFQSVVYVQPATAETVGELRALVASLAAHSQPDDDEWLRVECTARALLRYSVPAVARDADEAQVRQLDCDCAQEFFAWAHRQRHPLVRVRGLCMRLQQTSIYGEWDASEFDALCDELHVLYSPQMSAPLIELAGSDRALMSLATCVCVRALRGDLDGAAALGHMLWRFPSHPSSAISLLLAGTSYFMMIEAHEAVVRFVTHACATALRKFPPGAVATRRTRYAVACTIELARALAPRFEGRAAPLEAAAARAAHCISPAPTEEVLEFELSVHDYVAKLIAATCFTYRGQRWAELQLQRVADGGGDAEATLKGVEELCALGTTPPGMAVLAPLRARALLAAGRDGAAEAGFREAAQRAQDIAAHFPEAMALLWLARMGAARDADRERLRELVEREIRSGGDGGVGDGAVGEEEEEEDVAGAAAVRRVLREMRGACGLSS